MLLKALMMAIKGERVMLTVSSSVSLTGPADGSGEMQFWLEKAVFAIAALGSALF